MKKLFITSVNSAYYDKKGIINFNISAYFNEETEGEYYHQIPSKYPDVDKACENWLKTNTPHPCQNTESGIRDYRNKLLLESDWRMISDYQGTDQAEWQTYRQELRDIPTQSGFPTLVTWPTKP